MREVPEIPNAERQPISAFVIAFNEELNIHDCISSLQFCDEIVVIDSFSTDRTVEIAASLGARVVSHAWEGYVGQKAFGLQQVSNEWVVNIDADERISDELRANIIRMLESDEASEGGSISGFYINRLVYHLGRWWRQGGWYPEYRLRLFRKSKTEWGGVDPHERPIVEGKLTRMGGDILHYTYKDIIDQIHRLTSFAKISAEREYQRGKRASLRQLILNPVSRIFKFYVLKQGFREGVAGFIVAFFEGFYTFLKYARLWEIEHIESKREEKSGGS